MTIDDAVTFTAAGAAKLREALDAAGGSDAAGLRIDVQDGGCSGYQYRLALDVPEEADVVFEHLGVRILVASEHLAYVRGAQVDYTENASGAGFRVNNPNVDYSCGCGSSFVLREAAADAP
ncbi:MAG TPA: iron-sulfur cluster assembly accessory protein [Solirubrobacter sp.]|nr:iron-sulfur cluster assembly accessory protein [Solirubrobacter sp.]